MALCFAIGVAAERDLLGLLGEVQGGNGVLAHGLLVFVVKFGIFVLDDLAHADLGQFLGHQFLVEQAALDRRLVLNEGGNHFVQIFLADARGFLALGVGKPFDLDLELAGLLVEADVAFVGVVAAFAVVEARRRAAVLGFFGLNSKRGASTCSISKLAAMAFSVSLTASVTASSEASGSAIRLVKRARVLPGASRVARPMICTISVRLER